MDNLIRFHHLGVACQDIDKTAQSYHILGYSKGETIYDPLQNVKICFLFHPHMPTVELLAPVDEASPVNQTLKKNGTAPYHTCYIVDDMEHAVKYFKKNRFIVVSKPQNACAIDNKRVSFLYNTDMGLIELVEE